MATQHFCLFLKKRGAKNQHQAVRRGTCVFCSTRLSCYNDSEACFLCQEKIRGREFKRDGKIIAEEEGEVIFKSVATIKRGSVATFYRDCRGTCRGNGQTVSGEIFPKEKIIRLERNHAISSTERCGKCGGEILLFRDLVPEWARGFRVVARG